MLIIFEDAASRVRHARNVALSAGERAKVYETVHARPALCGAWVSGRDLALAVVAAAGLDCAGCIVELAAIRERETAT